MSQSYWTTSVPCIELWISQYVVDFAATPEEVFTRWDIVGHQVNRHLVSAALTGTPNIVADLITFPPAFAHRMHRHPYADLFMVPLSGSVRFLGVPGPGVDLRPEQLLVVPRNNWHELRNVGNEAARFFISSPVRAWSPTPTSASNHTGRARLGRLTPINPKTSRKTSHANSSYRIRHHGPCAQRAAA